MAIVQTHFEGFIKFSLQSIYNYLNQKEISCSKLLYNLQISALNEEFNAYDNLDKKCKIFSLIAAEKVL